MFFFSVIGAIQMRYDDDDDDDFNPLWTDLPQTLHDRRFPDEFWQG